MRVSGWHEVAQQVQARTVDLGIAEISALEGNEQFATELLGEHAGRLFCRSRHPLMSAGPLTPAMLFQYPWICPRLPGRSSTALPADLGAAGTIDPLNGDFVPAIEIDVPMHLDSFLHTSDALAINLLSNMESALLAGEVALVPVTGFALKAHYGFIYLRNRSLAPAAIAYMDEVRALEAEIRAKEQRLAKQFRRSLLTRARSTAQSTLHLALDCIGWGLDNAVVAGVIAGELRGAPLLVLLYMFEFMSPECDVVLRVLSMAKDDDIEQGHGIHIGVLQHGIGGIEGHAVADLKAHSIQHLQVVITLQRRADMQRNGLHPLHRGAVTRLFQPALQVGGSELINATCNRLQLFFAARRTENRQPRRLHSGPPDRR